MSPHHPIGDFPKRTEGIWILDGHKYPPPLCPRTRRPLWSQVCSTESGHDDTQEHTVSSDVPFRVTALQAVRWLLLTVLPRKSGFPEWTWPAEGPKWSRGPAHAQAGANTLSALLSCQGTEEGATQAQGLPRRCGAGAKAWGQISGCPAMPEGQLYCSPWQWGGQRSEQRGLGEGLGEHGACGGDRGWRGASAGGQAGPWEACAWNTKCFWMC